MLHRSLGATSLNLSEIGFGCASWWGMPAFDEAEALRLVHAAVDLGVTFLDTGAAYSRGAAEPRLGRALASLGARDLVVATKAGTRFVDGRVRRDMSVEAIEASAEASLKRLGLDHLSVLQLHGPALGELTPEFVGRLQGLKSRGLIRALGVNSFDPAVIRAAIAAPGVDVVMIDYNVLKPDRAALAAEAAAVGKGVLAGMPLAMGHIGRRPLRIRDVRDLWYHLRALRNHRREMAQGRAFRFMSELPEGSAAQVALAWVLRDPNVSCAVFGATRIAHLRENLQASGLKLSDQTLERIRAAQAL